MIKNKTIFFFLFLSTISMFKSLAQDPQLFGFPWLLEKVIINDIEHERTLESWLIFNNDDVAISHPLCEESYGTPILYENFDVFNIEDSPLILLGTCSDPVYTDFMEKHYSIYFLNSQFAKNPFNYTFHTNSNGTIVLTVTNNEGDQAVYTDPFLSTSDLTTIDISFHPNPTKDLLHFSSINNPIISIIVFNLLGKKVSQFNMLSEKEIDQISLANLDSGIYFLKIYSKKGLTTKRVIKR